MATVQQLLKNSGPFITKLLPFILEALKNNNPYQLNEMAKIVYNKQSLWGGGTVYEKQSIFPKQNTLPVDRNAAETVLVKNFQYAMNSFGMADTNSWLEFQKFVDVFYQMIDPIGYFLNNADPNWADWCPPYPSPCLGELTYYTERAGLYKRPYTAGDGTGFEFTTTVQGGVGVEEEFKIYFNMAMNPFPCPPTGHCWDLTEIENRYFTLGTGGAGGVDIRVFWFNTGTGVQPVVAGPGAVAYTEITIDTYGTQDYLQEAVEAAIEGTALWTIEESNRGGHVTLFKSASTGTKTDAADGRNGFATPVTTMRASDNTVMATGLVTDLAWQNAHNDLRIPYEKLTFDDDYMYLKSLFALDDNTANANQCPPNCCLPINSPSCSTPGYFLMTPAVGIITEIPVNVPGVLNNNRGGSDRLRVTN